MASENDLKTADGYDDDTILDHPAWTRNWHLEQDMLLLGRDRYRKAVEGAQAKEQMTRVGPYKRLLEKLVAVMARGVEDWVLKAKMKRGPKHIAYPFLCDGDKGSYSLITLRAVINQLGGKQGRGIVALAASIGGACEQQAKAIVWMEAAPELWHDTQKRLKEKKSTTVHKRRVNVHQFNTKVAEQAGWVPWAVEEKLRVGLALIDILVTYTKRFSLVPDDTPRTRKQKSKTKMFVLKPDEATMAWLLKAVERDELLHPQYMPMLVPPKRWSTLRDGGYWTGMVKPRPLVTFKVQHEEQRHRATDDLSAVEMPDVYRAVNFVQEVPWMINAKILDVAQAFWDMDLGIAGLPKKEQRPKPPKPVDIAENEAARMAWKQEMVDVYGHNARIVGHTISTTRCLILAHRYRDEEAFYFPHTLDFRGRMYPTPATLNPQGIDLARGLLTFKEGKKLDETARTWLAVHLANCWGIDKVSFADRVAWVDERWELWVRIAESPMEHKEWALEADKPWQALAAVIEYVAARSDPEYVSSLPVTIDGTCNGIQHLSALLRDPIGGAAVNLTPGDKPRDIYQEVADALTVRLRTIEEGGGDEGAKARMWLKLGSPALPRTLTKRPVMILPYGGTIASYNDYTAEWLKEQDPKGDIVPLEERYKHVGWLCRHMWSVVGEVVVAGMVVMKWLRKCAGVAALSGVPLSWQVPSGFHVRHFYAEMREDKLHTYMDGQSLFLAVYHATNKLDPRAQLSGIAPNYIHSLDASALVTSILIASHNGVSSMTSVHDAYGTVAADMDTLYACLRHGFVMTYRDTNVLESFRQACAKVTPLAKDRERLPVVPDMGALNIEDVLESSYFFG